MGFITLGGGKSDKETRAQAHSFLYPIYNLPRFIDPIFQMERLINSIKFYGKVMVVASMHSASRIVVKPI